MNVEDFFHLAHFNDRYIDELLNELRELKILRFYNYFNEIHSFDLHFQLDQEFIFQNFDTRDINNLTLVQISKVCVQKAISVKPLSDILSQVRIKSNFYPILTNAIVKMDYNQEKKEVFLNYYVKLMIVPDDIDI